MDYTIIGNEVNLASRLQSHAELGGILISHETYSLVKDAVLTEERDPIQAKGFPKPVRNYKVLDHYDQLISQSQVIREEKEGLSVFLDLQKMDRASAVETLKSILSRNPKLIRGVERPFNTNGGHIAGGSLPSSCRLSVPSFTELGGLLSYGFDRLDNFRRAATYADRILKGANRSRAARPGPGQVRAGDQYEDRQGARSRHAPTLLARADEVIE